MKLYAVFKEGVYRHDCYGIFSTQEKAEAVAKEAAEAETDDWHNFDVQEYALDVSAGKDGEGYKKPLASFKGVRKPRPPSIP